MLDYDLVNKRVDLTVDSNLVRKRKEIKSKNKKKVKNLNAKQTCNLLHVPRLPACYHPFVHCLQASELPKNQVRKVLQVV